MGSIRRDPSGRSATLRSFPKTFFIFYYYPVRFTTIHSYPIRFSGPRWTRPLSAQPGQESLAQRPQRTTTLDMKRTLDDILSEKRLSSFLLCARCASARFIAFRFGAGWLFIFLIAGTILPQLGKNKKPTVGFWVWFFWQGFHRRLWLACNELQMKYSRKSEKTRKKASQIFKDTFIFLPKTAFFSSFSQARFPSYFLCVVYKWDYD